MGDIDHLNSGNVATAIIAKPIKSIVDIIFISCFITL